MVEFSKQRIGVKSKEEILVYADFTPCIQHLSWLHDLNQWNFYFYSFIHTVGVAGKPISTKCQTKTESNGTHFVGKVCKWKKVQNEFYVSKQAKVFFFHSSLRCKHTLPIANWFWTVLKSVSGTCFLMAWLIMFHCSISKNKKKVNYIAMDLQPQKVQTK